MLSDPSQQVSGNIPVLHRTFCVRKFLEALNVCRHFVQLFWVESGVFRHSNVFASVWSNSMFSEVILF